MEIIPKTAWCTLGQLFVGGWGVLKTHSFWFYIGKDGNG
jgi:hypothetical protein